MCVCVCSQLPNASVLQFNVTCDMSTTGAVTSHADCGGYT